MARKSAKGSRPGDSPVDAAPVKARPSKLTLSLDGETVRRLKLLATYRGVHPRDLVSAAVADLVAGLVVYERPAAAPPAPPSVEPSAGGPERPQDAPGQARLWEAG